MKKKKTLSLNKLTVQKLTDKQLSNIQGGTGLVSEESVDPSPTIIYTTGAVVWTAVNGLSTGHTMADTFTANP